MTNKGEPSNVIAWRQPDPAGTQNPPAAPENAEVCEFIADMLDTLMAMAVEEDHAVLVYLLAMARIEALEQKQKLRP